MDFRSPIRLSCFVTGAEPHALRLSDGGVTGESRACAKKESVPLCQDEARGIETRTPNLGPDDIIDGPYGTSFPQNGLVHDCVIMGDRLLVGTGSTVVLIDLKTSKTYTLEADGSGAVALSAHYAAWSTQNRIEVVGPLPK